MGDVDVIAEALLRHKEHSHSERNDQGLGNVPFLSHDSPALGSRICRRDRLGGLLHFYEREGGAREWHSAKTRTGLQNTCNGACFATLRSASRVLPPKVARRRAKRDPLSDSALGQLQELRTLHRIFLGTVVKIAPKRQVAQRPRLTRKVHLAEIAGRPLVLSDVLCRPLCMLLVVGEHNEFCLDFHREELAGHKAVV